VVILIKYIIVILFIKIFISPVITPRGLALAILVNFCVLILITVLMLTNEDDYDPHAVVIVPGETPPENPPPPPNPTPLGHNRSYLVITSDYVICNYVSKAPSKSHITK